MQIIIIRKGVNYDSDHNSIHAGIMMDKIGNHMSQLKANEAYVPAHE
jgi:hypothetical protein